MVSYELIDVEGYDSWGVRITDGKYKDVVVGYGAVSAQEVPEHDHAKLNFEMGVLEPKEESAALEGDVDFKMLTGDILRDIIMSAFDGTEDYRIGGEDASESGNNNTQEPNSERALRSSSYTISEG